MVIYEITVIIISVIISALFKQELVCNNSWE